MKLLIVVLALMCMVTTNAEAARRDRREPKKEQVTGEAFKQLSRRLYERLAYAKYSNCTVEAESNLVRLIDSSGKWLGVVLNEENKVRIWRGKIGSQPILEIETHMNGHAPTYLGNDPMGLLRTVIFTDKKDIRITQITVTREEAKMVDIGSVSVPREVKQFSVIESVTCVPQ